MSLSPIRQRYLDVYPIRFTPHQPPLWFWLGFGLDYLDTISDAELKAKAMADYDRDKDELDDWRREIIKSLSTR